MNVLKGQHAGFIPCRAGSKRFPGKNRAFFNGQPLFMRALAASELTLDRTIISTDDDAILDRATCEKHVRPARLATGIGYRIDDVVIDMVKNIGEVPEFIHLIQVTSPFIAPLHIAVAKRLLRDEGIDSVQLVTLIPNIFHAFSQRVTDDDGFIRFRYPEDRDRCFNSQTKPTHYAFAGYVGFRTESLLKHGNIWGEKSLPIVGPPECAIDIDTPADLEYAEYVLGKRFSIKEELVKNEVVFLNLPLI